MANSTIATADGIACTQTLWTVWAFYAEIDHTPLSRSSVGFYFLFRIRTVTGTQAGRLASRPATSTKARRPAPARIFMDSIISTTFLHQNEVLQPSECERSACQQFLFGSRKFFTCVHAHDEMPGSC